MHIGIIGAGHGGVGAAEAAAAAGARVTLFSSERQLPYYRPRLVAMAVGQVEIEELHMHSAAWYRERGIELRLGTQVDATDPETRAVAFGGECQRFDALILATGAGPSLPAFLADAPPGVLPLWTAEHARQICARLAPRTRLAVIGGGILGVEAALRALDQGLAVSVIERMDRLMSQQLGPEVAGRLADLLRARGAELLLGAGVAAIRGEAERLVVALEDGREVSGAAVVVSIGARKNTALAEKAGLDVEGGLRVDRQMRTSAPGVFACGDVIALEGLTRCVALEALKQGRVAGANAAGGSLEYVPQDAPLSYKQGELEIHAVGPAEVEGAEVREIEGGRGALLVEGGLLVGVQLLGPRALFRQHERGLGRPLAGPQPELHP